jgi:hypothetical protein
MSTKTGGNAKSRDSREDHSDDGFPWISLDPETDRGENGLTPLILHRLGHVGASNGRTYAQLLAQKVIDLALGGHFPSLDEILIRIDGDAKTCDPGARAEKLALEIDDLRARRILDAYYDIREGPPGD